MIFAAAQTFPKRGNIKANLDEHYLFIEKAHNQGANLIVFPEMSITGYEREDAQKMAFSMDDERLKKLKKYASKYKMTIIAGAPILINEQLFIGNFIISPDKTVHVYTKQFLHSGENEFFISSIEHNPVLKIENEIISIAICADIDYPFHAENASKVGTTTYIASIFFSPRGIQQAHELLSSYAKKHSMNVLMANFCEEAYGMPAGGKSAFWNKNGEKIAELDSSSEGLLIIKETNDFFLGFQVYNKIVV